MKSRRKECPWATTDEHRQPIKAYKITKFTAYYRCTQHGEFEEEIDEQA